MKLALASCQYKAQEGFALRVRQAGVTYPLKYNWLDEGAAIHAAVNLKIHIFAV